MKMLAERRVERDETRTFQLSETAERACTRAVQAAAVLDDIATQASCGAKA